MLLCLGLYEAPAHGAVSAASVGVLHVRSDTFRPSDERLSTNHRGAPIRYAMLLAAGSQTCMSCWFCRYGLVRVRENAESIAFYGGEASEQRLLFDRLKAVVDNYADLLKTSRNLEFFTSFYRRDAWVSQLVCCHGASAARASLL